MRHYLNEPLLKCLKLECGHGLSNKRRMMEKKRWGTAHKVNTNFPQQLSISRVFRKLSTFFVLLRPKQNKKNKISYPMEDNGQTQSSDFLLIVWKLLTNRYRSERREGKFLRGRWKVFFPLWNLKRSGSNWRSSRKEIAWDEKEGNLL